MGLNVPVSVLRTGSNVGDCSLPKRPCIFGTKCTHPGQISLPKPDTSIRDSCKIRVAEELTGGGTGYRSKSVSCEGTGLSKLPQLIVIQEQTYPQRTCSRSHRRFA